MTGLQYRTIYYIGTTSSNWFILHTETQMALLELLTTALTGLFLTLDVMFSIVYYPYKALTNPSSSSSSTSALSKDVKTVVIVGGSFGGITALRHLYGQPNIRVILIDQRKYYEYIPSVLRLFCEPSLHQTISRPMPTLIEPNQFVHGKATEINSNNVVVTLNNGNNTTVTIAFDHLIIATGADYRSPITPTDNEADYNSRNLTWQDQAKRLKQSQSVLILGGGAVGTELAAEIVDYFPNKQVTIVDAQQNLVPLFPKSTQIHTEKWFKKRNTTLVLGVMLDKIDSKGCTTSTGDRYEADIVFVCFGMKCNTSAVAAGNMSESLNKRGAIEVNEFLQIEKYQNVFAVGDAMTHPSGEIKQAYYAEMNGAAAAHNILAMIKGNALSKYPECIAGSSVSPLVYVVSLGRYDGSLGFNSVVINGFVAALVKWVLEWTKIKQMEGRPIGLAVWSFGDAFTFMLSRNFIRPAKL